MTEGIVIDFGEAKAEIEEGCGFEVKRGKICMHRQKTIWRERRVVECKACNAVLDPFDTLLGLTWEWQRFADALERIKANIADAQTRLDDLLRQERNAKQRMKRLEKK